MRPIYELLDPDGPLAKFRAAGCLVEGPQRAPAAAVAPLTAPFEQLRQVAEAALPGDIPGGGVHAVTHRAARARLQ